jgi:hypothetical protein
MENLLFIAGFIIAAVVFARQGLPKLAIILGGLATLGLVVSIAKLLGFRI